VRPGASSALPGLPDRLSRPLRPAGLAARADQLFQELLHPRVDLVADGLDFIHGLPVRVRRIPIEVALAGEDRAGVGSCLIEHTIDFARTTRELSLRSDAPCWRGRRDQSNHGRNEDDLLEDACLRSCNCYDQRQHKECQDEENRDADQSQHDRTSVLA
jgi:hypothetical protein